MNVNTYSDNFSFKIAQIIRSCVIESYAVPRMFRKFKPKKNIKNCQETKSLKNIIYLSGDAHSKNLIDLIYWKFKIKPEVSLTAEIDDSGVQQCLFVRKFNPFGFKMPWD